MTAHVVVRVEPCGYGGYKQCRAALRCAGECDGCLGDGTRAVLDDAVPVERRREYDPCCGDGAYGPCDCKTGSIRTWREVTR